MSSRGFGNSRSNISRKSSLSVRSIRRASRRCVPHFPSSSNAHSTVLKLVGRDNSCLTLRTPRARACRTVRAENCSSPTLIEPCVGGTKPPIQRSNVLFPAPLCPTIATTSPRPALRLTSLTAIVAPKCFTRRSIFSEWSKAKSSRVPVTGGFRSRNTYSFPSCCGKETDDDGAFDDLLNAGTDMDQVSERD